MSVMDVVRRHSRPRELQRQVSAAVHLVTRRPVVGDDGLTDAERAAFAARYAATVGKTPAASPERTERLEMLEGKVEPRRHLRRRPAV